MKLLDIVHRPLPPVPWEEGDKIPWNDLDFSARMLKEHLSQAHDAASRRFEKIDQHVTWIHHTLLTDKPAKILDLGCGPGLYASRLTQRGHTCLGIDFSPASIAYAKTSARDAQLECTYVLQDIRQADYGTGYNLVMFIYSELNVFRRSDIMRVLQKAYAALRDDGQLLLEVSKFEAIKQNGLRKPEWHTETSGLFSDRPHLYLEERFWNSEYQTTITRFFVIDATRGEVERHVECMQAYTDAQYRTLLEECGFRDIAFFPSLTGEVNETQDGLFVIVARK